LNRQDAKNAKRLRERQASGLEQGKQHHFKQGETVENLERIAKEIQEPSKELDNLAHQVIGIEVHRILGPGYIVAEGPYRYRVLSPS
jgi:hypothetical protein